MFPYSHLRRLNGSLLLEGKPLTPFHAFYFKKKSQKEKECKSN